MRSFRLQFRYCKKAGLCKAVRNPIDGKDILLCVNFIDICSSAACRDYRASFSSANDKAVARALKD